VWESSERKEQSSEGIKKIASFPNFNRIQAAQAKVRRIIRKAKRESWQNYCSRIGRATPVGEIWGMIRSMRGMRKVWQYPVLKRGEETAASDGERAERMAKARTEIHSSDNLTVEGKRGRERTQSAHRDVLGKRDDTNTSASFLFLLYE